MPSLPQPSSLITCSDLSSCLQNLYNLLFAFLVAFAFVYFLWGAIEYLGSGANIMSKDKGKKKMMNAIVGLILALIIPIFLYMINPNIFELKWKIPIIIISQSQNNGSIDTSALPPGSYNEVSGGTRDNPPFGSIPIYYATLKSYGSTYQQYICPPSGGGEYNKNKYKGEIEKYACAYLRKEVIDALEGCVKQKVGFHISNGGGYKYKDPCNYDWEYAASGDPCHIKYGNCVDISPVNTTFQNLMNALTSCGFHVLNESGSTLNCGDSKIENCGFPHCSSTGPHLHAILDIPP